MNDKAAETIFDAALQLDAATKRKAYLDLACGDDADLRRKVEAMLDAYARAEDFFASAGVEPDTAANVDAKTALVASPLSEGSGAVIGRYKLLEKLGEGGFGAVWAAEQREPVKRRVALKIIKLGMDTKQVVARFEAERQALAMMDHPNIAKVLDAGATDTGRPYFVMELVRGVPITDYCDQNRLTTGERLGLFTTVCLAVQHAHQKGVIHRDIKPSNILVTPHDGVPVPKVIDFGIAKATQQELTERTVVTQFQQMIGTPAYMSPEQAEMSGLDIDTRSDIYSLGVLLYELLTGRTPLDGKALLVGGYDEIRRRIKEEEPPKPSTRAETLQGEERTTVAKYRKMDPARLGSELKGELDWILMKALEKDRTRRYDTAKGFANDLRRYLNHEPVEAAAPSVGYRYRKFLVRHRAAVAVTAAIAGLLVSGTMVSIWQAVRATQASTRERQANRQAVAALEAAQQLEHRANREALAACRNLYVSDIHLARQALEASDLRRARELLGRHIPRINAGAMNPTREALEDLRGWEWRYLWSQLQTGEPEIFATLPGPVFGLALSPDAHHLAASTTSGLLKLWELASGREVATIEPGEDLPTKPVFFRDNSRLVYHFWTSQSTQGLLRIWDLQSQQVVREITYPSLVGPKAVDPNGQRILFGVLPDVVRLFDLTSGIASWEVHLPLGGDMHSSDSLLFVEPEGREWILGDPHGDIGVFDVETGQRTAHWPAHSEKITALKMSGDGRLLASAAGYSEETIKVWNFRRRELLGELKGHQSWVSDVEFTSNGRRLVSSSADQTVRLWDLSTFIELAVFRGQDQEVWEVEISPDDRKILAGAKNGSIYVWDATAKSRKDSLVIADDLQQFALPKSGLQMALLSEDGSVKTGTLQDNISLTAADYAGAENSFVSLSADGRQLIAGKTDGGIAVYDIETGQLVHCNHTHGAPVSGVRMLASGDRLLSSDRERNLLLQHINDGKAEILWKTVIKDWEPSTPIQTFTVSSDERTLAVGNFFGLVTLREMATSREVGTFQNPSPHSMILNLAFSPDGEKLATADAYGVVGIWDIATLRRGMVLQGHRNAARALAFSRDGKRLLSGGLDDEAVMIWDLTTGQPLLQFQARGLITQLAFSPNEDRAIALSSSGNLHAWRAPP